MRHIAETSDVTSLIFFHMISILNFTLNFDALLVGHEGSVNSVTWRPTLDGLTSSTPTLLSTSTDSSLILWSPIPISAPLAQDSGAPPPPSIWVSNQRFGDVGGQKLGGFVGGIWNTRGEEVLGWGWNGGWRRWRLSSLRATQSQNDLEEWNECTAVTGHQGPVKGMGWDPKGEYLITTRLAYYRDVVPAIIVLRNNLS